MNSSLPSPSPRRDGWTIMSSGSATLPPQAVLTVTRRLAMPMPRNDRAGLLFAPWRFSWPHETNSRGTICSLTVPARTLYLFMNSLDYISYTSVQRTLAFDSKSLQYWFSMCNLRFK